MKTELQQMTEIERADKASRRVKDLGWANGWGETPAIVKACAHKQVEVSLGSCLSQISCLECGFTYRVRQRGLWQLNQSAGHRIMVSRALHINKRTP
jgi:hypothetical protein